MMLQKKLLHVSASQFPPLSVHHSTKEIWIELAREFDSYHLVARSQKNQFEYYTEGNIHLYLIPKIGNKSRWFILSSWLILIYYLKIKPNYILCQSSIFGGLVCIVLKKLFHIPVLMEIHGEEYFRILEGKSIFNKFGSFYIKYIFKNSTKVRSLNSLMTFKLNQNKIFNIVEINNRVNFNIFKLSKSNFEIKSSLIRLVSVGRFVNEKNYLNLIRTLLESDIKFHLTLIGGGALKEEYLKLIKSRNSLEYFTLIDWCSQDELVGYIINADIYIQSSLSEGMPRTIIEAMALKMPIITTDVGSIAGVIQDNYNGLLVSSRLNELVPSIKKLINDKTLRTQISQNAYEDAHFKYDWIKCFQVYRNEILSMK